MMMLAVSIWLAPILIGAQPPSISTSYLVVGVTNFVSVSGHISPWNLYLYWPGPVIYYSAFTEYTGIPLAPHLVLVVPLFMQLLTLALIKTIVPRVFQRPSSQSLSWLAVWFYFLANWTGQLYLADQGFAFLLILLMVRFILLPDGITKSLLIALVFTAIVTSHGLSSILAVGLLMAFAIARKVQTGVVVTSLGIITAWVIYDLNFFLHNAVASIQEYFFNPRSLIQSNIISQIAGSPGHVLVVHTELYYTLLLLATAITAFAINLYTRANSGLLRFVILFSIPTILSAIAIGNGYGFELVTRVYLFLTVPLSLLVITCANWRLGRVFLICLLIVMIPMDFVSQYGNSTYENFAPSYVSLSSVFSSYAHGGAITGCSLLGEQANAQNFLRASWFPRENVSTAIAIAKPLAYSTSPNAVYLCISQSDLDSFRIAYNDNTTLAQAGVSMETSARFALVLETSTVTVFLATKV